MPPGLGLKGVLQSKNELAKTILSTGPDLGMGHRGHGPGASTN